MVGAFPDLPRLVLIGAPHSSNWDGVWGLAAKIALGLDMRVLGKDQLFWWPLGPLLRRLGVIPVTAGAAGRGRAGDAIIRDFDRIWFGAGPGRHAQARWRSGRPASGRSRARPMCRCSWRTSIIRRRSSASAGSSRPATTWQQTWPAYPRVVPAVAGQEPRHGLTEPVTLRGTSSDTCAGARWRARVADLSRPWKPPCRAPRSRRRHQPGPCGLHRKHP